MIRIFLGLGCLLAAVSLQGQRVERVPKYAIGIEMDVGHSFPAFDREQDEWKATFYPAGALSVLLAHRLGKSWSADLGIGLTAYSLTNRGPVDRYTLDFVSPHLQSGISFSRPTQRGKESFVRLTTGFQLGYRGSFTDVFETYLVTIEGKRSLYYFVRPEIGIRRTFRKKLGGARHRMAYEFGTFFRYNWMDLGSARIQQPGSELLLQPRGNIVGGYYKILLPAGRRKVRIEPPEQPLPPVIYHPRAGA